VKLGAVSREDVCVICRVSDAAAYRPPQRAVTTATERRSAIEETVSQSKV